jgi:hypothetical protein
VAEYNRRYDAKKASLQRTRTANEPASHLGLELSGAKVGPSLIRLASPEAVMSAGWPAKSSLNRSVTVFKRRPRLGGDLLKQR